MAKKPVKKRDKSYNRDASRRKLITTAVTRMLGTMFFVGDNRHDPVCFAESKLQNHLKGHDLIQGKTILTQLLIDSACTWSILVIGFIKRGNEIDVVTGSRITEEISGYELFSNFIPYVHEVLHGILDADGTPHEELHSYSYFVNMGDIYDFDKMEPNLIERMFRSGLSEDKHNLDVEELVGFEEFVMATRQVFMPKVKAVMSEEMILKYQEDIIPKYITKQED